MNWNRENHLPAGNVVTLHAERAGSPGLALCDGRAASALFFPFISFK